MMPTPDMPRPEPGFDFADQISGRSADNAMTRTERLIYAAAAIGFAIFLAATVIFGGRP